MHAVPSITIVTPSMNQGAYLDAAIRSVTDQNYPHIEYLVVDGGSRDGSVDIIRSHEKKLSWWVSEPDRGQYDAINKGFARSTGEIMGWLNSDDMYLPWTLSVVGEVFGKFPDVEWITSMYPLGWDIQGRAVSCRVMPPLDHKDFLRGGALPIPKWHGKAWIMQEATFWRRSLWEKAGGKLDTSYPLAADLELWARFFKHADLVRVGVPLAGFRMHPEQKTCALAAKYLEDAERVMQAHDGKPAGAFGRFLEARVFPGLSWRGRKLMSWCGGAPRFHRICQCDARGGGWCLERIWV